MSPHSNSSSFTSLADTYHKDAGEHDAEERTKEDLFVKAVDISDSSSDQKPNLRPSIQHSPVKRPALSDRPPPNVQTQTLSLDNKQGITAVYLASDGQELIMAARPVTLSPDLKSWGILEDGQQQTSSLEEASPLGLKYDDIQFTATQVALFDTAIEEEFLPMFMESLGEFGEEAGGLGPLIEGALYRAHEDLRVNGWPDAPVTSMYSSMQNPDDEDESPVVELQRHAARVGGHRTTTPTWRGGSSER
ncbi:hypothetical protein AYO20_11503 [Fonsecaea nubica]|uniref:Uncharacterized protein n=1 Tax=Fonsecaea nubica TaxID=856822 RepID=A0A178BTU6_9EURO|nr:hypothetical protein AYO20_11503 [Fonsecaea nubica]OAL20352.1 hypothetical protein AYO20_11503 [Fonsecaea nubica]